MNDRPTLSIKPELLGAAKKKLGSISTEAKLEMPKEGITTLGDAALGSGSIPLLLDLSGAYNEYGSFKPHLTNRLKIGEPRLREVYWCRFTDMINPEFGKERPVVILSKKNRIGTYSIVAPITTEDENDGSENAVALSKNPNPNGGYQSWVIASHLYSVSHWRLRRFWDKAAETLVTPRISNDDLESVLQVLSKTLPGQSPPKTP